MNYKCKACGWKPTPGGVTEWDSEALKWCCPECNLWNPAPFGGIDKTGLKYDDGKIKPRLVIEGFPRALRAVAEVATFGAEKYTENGWQSVEDGVKRYTDAMHRHILDEAAGENLDPESGLKHAAHAAWNALARLELMLREEEKNVNKNY